MAKTRRQYSGGAVSTTVASSLAASGVSTFVIASSTGWPSSAGVPFYIVVSPQTSSEEKMLVTISGTTVTIVSRGVDGTSASSHASGATVYPVITAIDLDEANELTAKYASRGSIVYQGATTFEELAKGSSGLVLKAGTNDPEWGQVATAGIADDAVTAAKIATNAVGADEIASGAVGTAELADDAVTSTKIAAPTLTAKTDSFTLALVDENCTMQCNKATGMTVTVPTSSVAFANGSIVTLMQYGAGQVTVAGDTGVTIRSSNGLKLRAQYSMATLVKISNTEWVLSGDTVA